MKRILASLLSVLCLLTALTIPSFASSVKDYPIDEEYYRDNPYRGTVLNVFNWGEYISDGSEGSLNVNQYFEELTGIKVNYTNFDTCEDMYAKVKSGGANYDVIIPSDYMIERMKEEGLLEKLNYDNIPNFKYIDSKYKNLYFDENNEYTVAYNVGTVGIIYNTKMVKEAPTGWSCMWDEQYAGQILMFNNPRDSFAVAQSYLGLDYNSTNEADWLLAYDKLLEQKPLVRAYVMDEVYNIMESGAAAIAPYYVGDYLLMKENNDDLAFCYPEEGANIFVDAMCIPTTTQNKGAAELYINFMEEPSIALENAETIMYATPNSAVVDMEEYSLQNNPLIYPDDSVTANYQWYHNLDSDTQTLMSNLFSDLKVDGNANTSIYVGLICFVLLVIGYAIFRILRRKRREKYYD